MVSTNQLRYFIFLSIFLILWLLIFLHSYYQTKGNERTLDEKLESIDDILNEKIQENLAEILEKWSNTEVRLQQVEEKLGNIKLDEIEVVVSHTKEAKRTITYLHKIAILIIACNRVEVKSIIQQTLEYSQDRETFPLFVSQDCGDVATKRVILEFKSQLTYLEHNNKTQIEVGPRETHMIGYYKISRHYKWAIDQVFAYNSEIDSLVILEDDMIISFDFFDYFKSMRPLLDIDTTVWCISAWNDNGKVELAHDNSLFYRTDFMPGLGWMLTKNVWNELRVKWPPAFWDDWMRGDEIRKNRVCIRPEVSRTKLYVQKGVSGGLFFDRFYKYWALNDKEFDFNSFDINSLAKVTYDHNYFLVLRNAKTVSADEIVNNNLEANVQYKILYKDYQEYKRLANRFGLMDDERGGVLRTAYHGAVTFYYVNKYVHLVPAELLKS
ncbi:hypothetical protein LOD99_11759 [Oopsacas minuta]|uniref:Alpha-1,3-mannosyl-glycoprotein 2-beta-N-acetylglucosaminyltransferase n=1 Tax=Oopsacas minuta TaxID=111878 RepID=A0AAV7JKC0_9METZ|nr:hypothetical protein LOD99_11759 [Oopsacas minuta]